MPSPIRQLVPECAGEAARPGAFVLETGGFDTLDVACYGSWHAESWQRTATMLDERRAMAENVGERQAAFKTKRGDLISVAASGCRKGVYCRWMLESDGIQIAIVNRQFEHETVPSLFVHIGSVPLMDRGAAEMWHRAKSILAGLGFKLSRDVVSRADLCVDLAGVDVAEFVGPFLGGQAICRANDWGVRGSGVPGCRSSTGFSLGKNYHVRVYEKLKECHRDAVKLPLLIERRWGCLPEKATRVEFQLRRTQLRELQVEGVDDLLAKAGGVAKWLTYEWFRLVEPFDRENRNHDRAATLPIWRQVQEAFAAWCGEAEAIRPQERLPLANVQHLVDMLNGCLGSAVAHLQCRCDSAEDYVRHAVSLIHKFAEDGFAKFSEKVRFLQAEGRLRPGLEGSG